MLGAKEDIKEGLFQVSFLTVTVVLVKEKDFFFFKISAFNRKHPASCILMSCLASRRLDNPPPSWTGGSSSSLSSTSLCFLITVVVEGYPVLQKTAHRHKRGSAGHCCPCFLALLSALKQAPTGPSLQEPRVHLVWVTHTLEPQSPLPREAVHTVTQRRQWTETWTHNLPLVLHYCSTASVCSELIFF